MSADVNGDVRCRGALSVGGATISLVLVPLVVLYRINPSQHDRFRLRAKFQQH